MFKGSGLVRADVVGATFEDPPAAGSQWRALQHSDLLEAMINRLGRPSGEEYTLSSRNRNLHGALYYGTDIIAQEAPVRIMVGFANHNDLRRPLTFFVGYEIMGGGIVTKVMGSTNTGSHRVNYQNAKLYDEVVVAYRQALRDAREYFERAVYAAGCDDGIVYCALARAGACTWARLAHVDAEVRELSKTVIGRTLRQLVACGRVIATCTPLHSLDYMAAAGTVIRP